MPSGDSRLLLVLSNPIEAVKSGFKSSTGRLGPPQLIRPGKFDWKSSLPFLPWVLTIIVVPSESKKL